MNRICTYLAGTLMWIGTLGCGPAFPTGDYSGTIFQSLNCQDGSGPNRIVGEVWSIRQVGTQLEIESSGPVCSPAGATVDGDQALVFSRTCPPDGSLLSTVTSGRMQISDDGTISLHVIGTTEFMGGAGVPPLLCDDWSFGSLALVRPR